MGLAMFDNIWCCDKCGERIKDKNDFIYCPNCGNVLKHGWYQRDLKSINEVLKECSRSICEDCYEEFDEDYNFCPFCSNKLKKESINRRIEKDNSIIAQWNGDDVCIFDKDRFLSSPHFSADAVIKCFKDKNRLDEKLESDFMKIGEKPPKKLSYEETYSIVELGTGGKELRGIKFIPELSEDSLENKDSKSENEINPITGKEYTNTLKIRENLYAKLEVVWIEVF